MAKRGFVTGASGFVGGKLVHELLRLGWQVTALVRASSPLDDLPGSGLDLKFGDITDTTSLEAAIPRGVDAIFHVAANTGIWSGNNEQQSLINIEGTRNVVDAAIKAGAKRLLHTSSIAVWGQRSRVINEHSPRHEGTDWINYIHSKQAAEEIVRAATNTGDIDAVILNPANILGPGDRRNWSRMIRMVSAGNLPGAPPGGGSFADVREIAKAHIQAFEHGRRGQNYLLGGEHWMFIDIVHMIGEILDRPVPKRPLPGIVLKAAARVYAIGAGITGREPVLTPEGAELVRHDIEIDSSRACNELGYRYTPVRRLLVDTCQWMQAKGMLT